MGTQITQTGAQAVLALRSMEANAFRVSQVATRLLDEHTDLPEPIGVRPEATQDSARLALQPHTVEDARQWAAALGVDLTVEDVDGYTTGWRIRQSQAKTLIDGVVVYLVTSQTYSPREWAALMAAEQVAA